MSYLVPSKRLKSREEFERFKGTSSVTFKKILEYIRGCDIPLIEDLTGEPATNGYSPSDIPRDRRMDFRAPADDITLNGGVNFVHRGGRGTNAGGGTSNGGGGSHRAADARGRDAGMSEREREELELRRRTEEGGGCAGRNEFEEPIQDRVEKITSLLKTLLLWIDEIPLEPRTDMRFGNRTFRTWCKRLEEEAPRLIRERVLPPGIPTAAIGATSSGGASGISTSGSAAAASSGDLAGADAGADVSMAGLGGRAGEQSTSFGGATSSSGSGFGNAWEEFATYFVNSFGDCNRIDYGTGHELNFLCAIYCLEISYGYFTARERTAFVLPVFQQYMAVMRKLQSTYVLEPAGSHGVWGLDDFHHIVYIFGANQLRKQELAAQQMQEPGGAGGTGGQSRRRGPDVASLGLSSSTVLAPDMVLSAAEASSHHAYLFVAAVRNILDTKRGAPFHETSPQLYDILHSVPSWERLYQGLIKMYIGEVLEKFPVAQHFLFGTTLPYE
eukprot:g15438.t1